MMLYSFFLGDDEGVRGRLVQVFIFGDSRITFE